MAATPQVREFYALVTSQQVAAFLPQWARCGSQEVLTTLVQNFASQPEGKQTEILNALKVSIETAQNQWRQAQAPAHSENLMNKKEEAFRAYQAQQRAQQESIKKTTAMLDILKVLTDGELKRKALATTMQMVVEQRLKARDLNADEWKKYTTDEDWCYALERHEKEYKNGDYHDFASLLAAANIAIADAEIYDKISSGVLSKEQVRLRIDRLVPRPAPPPVVVAPAPTPTPAPAATPVAATPVAGTPAAGGLHARTGSTSGPAEGAPGSRTSVIIDSPANVSTPGTTRSDHSFPSTPQAHHTPAGAVATPLAGVSPSMLHPKSPAANRPSSPTAGGDEMSYEAITARFDALNANVFTRDRSWMDDKK